MIESVVFANEDEVSLAKPINSIQSTNWLGTSLGSVVKSGENKIKLSSPPAITPYAGVLTISYSANALIYRLSNTLISGEDNYDIVNFWLGTAV